MTYNNGDIYNVYQINQGKWINGQKQGFGIMTF